MYSQYWARKKDSLYNIDLSVERMPNDTIKPATEICVLPIVVRCIFKVICDMQLTGISQSKRKYQQDSSISP